uniref:Uncharacterized protein n=1 Tax=Strongyloides papillosus TaxID=174720 RepID=A0A0N5BW08_STREA
MEYSGNSREIKLQTNVKFINDSLIESAIFEILSNSQLDDDYCESFNSIMNIAKAGNYKDMDREKLREQFEKFLVFKDAMEDLRLYFKSTMKLRTEHPLPDEITINGHHTLRSLYYCVCQVIPHPKNSSLHYLTFINLLLHMNNRFGMTFIDPSTNKEPVGEAPTTCYVKKYREN